VSSIYITKDFDDAIEFADGNGRFCAVESAGNHDYFKVYGNSSLPVQTPVPGYSGRVNNQRY